ncbi:molybdopterin-dependent oxidoreductase [Gordonia sp. HNM0687]|uniref:Molybdopterin-dependent oxidoreductase n=1 Tax=Gordonia mangrovi TaxID=2665643 RepID=A0A6L7GTR8_9ACTN|nr:xanthine dehydrogenase family protein molybdopterin-binding subunit [Gordonia mangrovi]MXP23414.1 molybdopterin-dependent oxidoreductase [Gordonia mangrovi]UVF76684.1 xanthine dehydrogenase family protein molybdopterin-binding subunit [Gordonia mangrovi]
MRLVGASVQRVEDARILTGKGKYVDDVKLPRMLHAAFLRSPFPHARVNGIDAEDARRVRGVVAVLTGDDIAAVTKPYTDFPVFLPPFLHSPTLPLATDRVRFVGDPVAIVVAENRYIAEDAMELIDVDYDPLDAVADMESALDPNSVNIFEDLGSNVAYRKDTTFGDVDAAFAEATHVVRETLRQERQANVPMETRGVVADYDAGLGSLTFHASTQSPQTLRTSLANLLDIPLERVRVLAQDVGGGFGLKSAITREDIAIGAASRLLGQPVKWIEDRNEHLLASGHARDERMDVELALADDGTILGLRATLVIDQGAYTCLGIPAAQFPDLILKYLPGPYRVGALAFTGIVVTTNKCTVVPYRGPWEIETWVRERIVDLGARAVGLDPTEFRRRALFDGDADDHGITGYSLAGITSRQSMDRALELAEYSKFREEQVQARAAGRALGIGFATYLEAAPGPMGARGYSPEDATVRMEPNGHVVVITSQQPHGQGHQTTLAQLAADELGVPFDHVRVMYGDTDQTPYNLIGTGGSRAATWASGAVVKSARVVRQQILDTAAEMLEIDASDLAIADGVVAPNGAPASGIPISSVAHKAYFSDNSPFYGQECGLEATETFTEDGVGGSGWSGGTHLCIVELDLDTGAVDIVRYIAVSDCGRLINPAIVEGQIRGGVAQGIAGVLYEKVLYDTDGGCQSGTFMDYLLPTSAEVPLIEIEHIESAPTGGIDHRGIGEGGAIVAPAALTSAIEDALAHLDVRITEQYLPPARILELAGVVAAER